MKKLNISNILISISLIITSFLICNWYDEYNKNRLLNYNYNVKDTIYISSKLDISQNKIEYIENLAKSNSILLEKIVIKNENNIKGNYHYLSMEDLDELIINFNTSNIENSKKGLSTYLKDKQYIFIKDFLNNDYHNFLLFDDFFKQNTNYSGEYNVFYNNKVEYSKFISSVASYLNVSESELISSSFSKSSSNFEMIKNIYLIVILIIFLSSFILSLYSSFKKSQEIGIYKLNGISNIRIGKNIVFKSFILNFIISIFIFLFTIIIIPNRDFNFSITLVGAYLVILFIELFLNIISVILIIKKMKLSDLIKKKSLTSGIIKFNSFFKIIVLAITIVLSTIIMMNLKSYNERKNELKQFEKYSDYSVFAKFYEGSDFSNDVAESDELDIAELELYKYLNNYDILYADFKTYFIETQDEANYYSYPTNQGNKKYKYGTIDYNYLNDLNLINSNTNKVINIDKNFNSNIFIIPKSLESEMDSFKSFYYEYYTPKDNDLYIIYNDADIPSLSPDIAKETHYLISSPIMRVITPNNVEIRDVNVYGSGYDTALKIKIGDENDKIDFYNKIHQALVELKLDDNININVFYTYNELFSNELNNIKQQIATFTIVLSLLLICYIFVIIQENILYLKDESKAIFIKKLNGFSNYKIFNFQILNSIVMSIIVIILLIGFLFKSLSIHYLLICSLLYVLIEFILSIIIIKITMNRYISIAIKGGEL